MNPTTRRFKKYSPNQEKWSRRDVLRAGTAIAGTAALSSIGGTVALAKTTEDELSYKPASELLNLFKSKQLSPVEVLKAQFKRIETVAQSVNCFTYTHFDAAMAMAVESEKRYMNGSPRALEGITIALKDEFDKVGWITTAGSKLLKDNVAKSNHPAVDKLLASGAVMHAQTTVPEMYFAAVTWTDLWGVTRNPWNLHYAVGGSSGGSGAALAAGLTTLATGSDMGGSTRIPCAFNGLYGFKPPYGRNPPGLGSTFLLPATEGPMARTFEDMVRMQNAMVGPGDYTPTAMRPALELPLSYSDIKGIRIAYDMDQSWAVIDGDTQKNTLAALKILEDQGAIVEEVDLALNVSGPDIRSALVKALLSGGFGADMAELSKHADQLTTYGRYFANIAAKGMGPQQAKEAGDAIVDYYKKVQDAVFLKGYDALIMPTLATSDIAADFDPTKDIVTVDGVEVDPHVGWVLIPLFNLLNWNPVAVAPTGLSSKNVPTGMQIAAKTYDDATCMRIAAAYSAAAPGLYTGDRYPDFRNAP
jgi:amidase